MGRTHNCQGPSWCVIAWLRVMSPWCPHLLRKALSSNTRFSNSSREYSLDFMTSWTSLPFTELKWKLNLSSDVWNENSKTAEKQGKINQLMSTSVDINIKVQEMLRKFSLCPKWQWDISSWTFVFWLLCFYSSIL